MITKRFLTKQAAGALFFLALIVCSTAFAGLISDKDPLKLDLKARLDPPTRAHILGTDQMGRDLFARTLYGGRGSIGLAVLASTASMLVGLIIGIYAGYYGRALDAGLLFITNIMQGLPSLVVMLALSATLGPGIKSILIALVSTSWTSFSRIVRGEALRLREEDFIEGLRLLGLSHFLILFKHLVPNMAGKIIVAFTTRVSASVLSIASLSFLGFGIQPPVPDWGMMTRDALDYFRSAPLLIIAPGLAVFLTCLCINILGDALRDCFDVRLDSRRL